MSQKIVMINPKTAFILYFSVFMLTAVLWKTYHDSFFVNVLYIPSGQVKNFAVIYLVDITEVPDFNKMYELYDPCTVMFFFR